MRTLALSLVVAGCFLSGTVGIDPGHPSIAPTIIAPKINHDEEAPESSVSRVRNFVMEGRRNDARPFLVIDKQSARLFVFSSEGVLEAESPILLGEARGDFSVPGIGERRISDIKLEEKTTPAGSFFARSGVNLSGEDVVWVDYDAGVSMHRVRATNPAEKRLERLASETPLDNRISFGCINVPKQFYELRVRPIFVTHGAWIFVIPETLPVETLTAGASRRSGALMAAVPQP